jgi:hypothetical protein
MFQVMHIGSLKHVGQRKSVHPGVLAIHQNHLGSAWWKFNQVENPPEITLVKFLTTLVYGEPVDPAFPFSP